MTTTKKNERKNDTENVVHKPIIMKVVKYSLTLSYTQECCLVLNSIQNISYINALAHAMFKIL